MILKNGQNFRWKSTCEECYEIFECSQFIPKRLIHQMEREECDDCIHDYISETSNENVRICPKCRIRARGEHMMTESELTLTEDQLKAVRSLERAFKKCEKVNLYIHNCYKHLIAFDYAVVRYVDDDETDIPLHCGCEYRDT